MEPSGPDPAPWLLGQKAAVMPSVELTTSVCDGHLVVALCGDLDVTGAADAEAAITALVARGQYLVIDMSALDFLDCSALGALLRARALARRGGGDVVLAAPQPLVRRLLALTGNDEVFWVQAGVEAVVAGIASRRKRYSRRRLAVRTARPGRAAPSRTGTG
jgi:anti-sigma B factor antagonist